VKYVPSTCKSDQYTKYKWEPKSDSTKSSKSPTKESHKKRVTFKEKKDKKVSQAEAAMVIPSLDDSDNE